jgi:hypothetical protein
VTNLEYIVLFQENLDEVAELTGKPKEKLQDLLSDAQSYGHHVVLWHEFNTWFAVRIDKEFVNDGLLDAVMQQILRRPH